MHVWVGAQMEAAKEAGTKVENPDDPQQLSTEPAVKRQHLIVMRHGERIDEVHQFKSVYGLCTTEPQHVQSMDSDQHCLILHCAFIAGIPRQSFDVNCAETNHDASVR